MVCSVYRENPSAGPMHGHKSTQTVKHKNNVYRHRCVLNWTQDQCVVTKQNSTESYIYILYAVCAGLSEGMAK